MKILFLISSLPHLSKHGLYSDFIAEVAAHGHEVKVASPCAGGCDEGLQEENGIAVARFNSGQLTANKSFVKKGVAYLLLMFRYPHAVRKYFRDEQFDLIYANSLPLEIGVVVKILKRKYHAKGYVMLCDFVWQDLVSLHVLGKHNPIIWYYRLMERVLYRSVDYIGGLSQGYIDMVRKYHPFTERTKSSVIVPWTTEETILNKDSDTVLSDLGLQGKFIALYGGNIGVAQDIDNVIRLAEACVSYQDIVFLIVGRGSQFDKIKQRIKRDDLENVRLLDFMPKEHYLQLVHACNVGIISLNKDLGAPNYPSKSASLFSMSIPIVASLDHITDFGRYLDENKVGLWSYSGDIDAFKNNLLRLYNNPQECVEMSQNARCYYEDNMTPKRAYDTFINQVKY